MNAEKNLIDSFLGFGMNDSRNLAENGVVGGDDSRQTRELDSIADDARFRRPSDPKSPASADSMKYGSTPTGVNGILDNSMDQQIHAKADNYSGSDYSRSPKRFHQNTDSNEGFSSDSFTLGALSRFNTDDESKSNGRFAQGGVMESGGYLIHEPEDAGNHAVPRGQLSSKDLSSGDLNHYGGTDFNNYEAPLSRSGSGGSGAGANRDMFGGKPVDATSPRGYPHLSQVSPRNAPPMQQHEPPQYAPQQQYQAPQQAPDYRQQQAPQGPQGQHQRYGQAPSPQQAQQQQQYPRGNRMLPQQSQMPPDSYYGAHAVDPYGGYKAPYAKPYTQPYRPQQGYAPQMPDPYAGYGAPPPQSYNAPRYAKPVQHQQPMGYRPPYGGRDMPDPQQDPYFRGGYAAPPPAPYGYGGYPQPQDDPYFNTGAGAVNRALGRPAHGYGNDNYGPPSYRNGGGGGNGGRFRNNLPVADSVNLDNIDMNTIVYQVQFKKTIRNFTLRPGDLTPVQTGDFVIVQADRGEDLGVITEAFPLQTFLDRRYAMRAYMDEEDQNVGYILRIASPSETKLLPEKFQDEEMIFKTCENLAIHTYRLPMTVVDVEYQFDRHKITIYYDSPLRIDFRELVRDLFSSFKARIWMKKINQFHAPDIQHFAAIALATGVQFTAGND